MADYKAELDDAVANLDRHFEELKQAAARAARLAVQPVGLSRDPDRPVRRLLGLPDVEPPDYLVGLSPDLYRAGAGAGPGPVRGGGPAGRAGVPGRVRHGGQSPDRADHGTNEDGTPKVFRDSAIDNLCDFFERFRSLNVRSNQQLDELVVQAQRAVAERGCPGAPRQRGRPRQVATQLSRVQTSLDAMLIDRPRRRILRNASAGGEG